MPETERPPGESPEATFNADVYVFAVQTAATHEANDVLDISQWAFYVLPRQTLEDLGYKSISLVTLERLTLGALGYGELAAAIRSAAS